MMIPHLPIVNMIAPALGAVAVFFWRVQEGRRAVTLKKIIIPPLGMSTGFCMFLVPLFRVPLLWALASFLIGCLLLAWPLVATTRLERQGEAIFMRRSKAFFGVVILLAAIRLGARSYFDTVMTLEQTAGLFFILAFGMILRWRLHIFFSYRSMVADPQLVAAE